MRKDNKYLIDGKNLEKLNQWTCTLYSIVHSLKISKDNNFEPKDLLYESAIDAKTWINKRVNYNSTTNGIIGKTLKMKFRRDPVINFEITCQRLAYMLIQDLVVIFDEILNDLLKLKKLKSQNYPQSKVESLKKYIKDDYKWSINGCMELIVVRNTISHCQGKWTKKSILPLQEYGIISEKEMDKLLDIEVVITFPMVFQYRKAIRTFINQVIEN